MIKINLLPEELRKVEKARRVRLNLTVIAGGVVVVGVIILVVVLSVVGQRVNSRARVRARLASLSSQAKEAEALIKKNHQLKKEIGLFQELEVQRLSWARCLNEVSDAVPGDLFLVQLNYRSRQPYVMVIRGETVKYRGGERVVEFIDNLRESPLLAKEFPRVSYYIENLGDGRKSFEIRCMRAEKGKKKGS